MTDDFLSNSDTTGVLTPGAALKGNLEVSGDRDWIAVDLTAGTLYRMSVDGARNGGGTQPAPIIFLRNAEGNLEARQDFEFMRSDPEYYFRPATSGTWYMDIWSFDPSEGTRPAGTYTARLEEFPGLADIGQTRATAGSIAVNTPITGLIESPRDKDFFAVELSAGVRYVVDLEGVSTDKGTLPDPDVMVFDSAGTRLPGQFYFDSVDEAVRPNNDRGEGKNSRFEFTAETDGTYYLEAGRYSPAFDDYDPRVGTYTLTIAEVPVEIVAGTMGDDWLRIPDGQNLIEAVGGAGRDMLSLDGAEGRVLAYLDDRQEIFVDGKHIWLDSIEGVTGSSVRDFFYGGDGDDWFRGLGGPDHFHGSAGADRFDGGDGKDMVSYNSNSYEGLFAPGVSASLLRGKGWTGDAAGDRYSSIEVLQGTLNGDNALTGDHADNFLYGWNGDDTLMGNGGDDVIYAGNGEDVILFGYDRDQYVVTQTSFALTTVAYIGPGAGDGTDTILNAEILRFADGDFIL